MLQSGDVTGRSGHLSRIKSPGLAAKQSELGKGQLGIRSLTVSFIHWGKKYNILSSYMRFVFVRL
jgi:hypothetical protein